MPTHFDSFYREGKILSPKKKAQLAARGMTKAVEGYIEDTSLDLKDAATFTFNRGSNAAKRVFAGVSPPHLHQMLIDQISPPLSTYPPRRANRSNVRSRPHAVVDNHMDQQQLLQTKVHDTEYVRSRGAAMSGYMRQRATFKVDDHMVSSNVADTKAHGYDYVDINSTIPVDDSATKAGGEGGGGGPNVNWRSSNPVPGMGVFGA